MKWTLMCMDGYNKRWILQTKTVLISSLQFAYMRQKETCLGKIGQIVGDNLRGKIKFVFT